jgi:hypothetical protein
MGIPLAALAVQPPPNPIDSAAKAVALKGLLQNQQYQAQAQPLELQQRQQATQQGAMELADSQARTAALKDWDGKDLNDLPGLVLKHGGSAQAVFGLKNDLITQRKNAAAADEATLNNEAKKNDIIAGHFESLKGVPAEQKQGAWDKTLTDLQQRGISKPGALQAQYPGDDALELMEKGFMGQKQIVDQAVNERKTKAQESEAATKELTAKTGLAHLQAELPGGPLNRVSQDVAIATNPAIQQGKINVATAEGAARANVEAQTARGANAALANVPPHLVPPATAAANKAGEDFAQAKSVSDRMDAMMDAAKRGNVVSYQLIPQEGALQVTTSQGVHRINMAEIQNYGGGSLWQRMEGHIGKQLTGKSIPDSVLNDMSELQSFMKRGSQAKYENSLKTINQNYGSNFKPVEMEGLPPSASATPKQPAGATHTGIGSMDKKKHWLDASGKDLGLAE